jgi:hypothetical protein
MSRGAKLICAAFLVALLCASIGMIAASAWSNEALRPAAFHPSTRDWDRGADPDYVQGLAKLGIVRVPDYKPPPPRSH